MDFWYERKNRWIELDNIKVSDFWESRTGDIFVVDGGECGPVPHSYALKQVLKRQNGKIEVSIIKEEKRNTEGFKGHEENYLKNIIDSIKTDNL